MDYGKKTATLFVMCRRLQMINPKYHNRLQHLISLARTLEFTGNFCTKGLSRIQVCAIVNTSEIMKSRGGNK